MLAAVLVLAALLDVPFVKQEKNGCGAAALAMVMEYWAHNGAPVASGAADERRIQRSLYSRQAGGIYASDLARYLEENGFRAFAFHAQWADLREHLAKGRPLVVSLGRSRLHYVVVAGIDADRGWVYVNDPARRKLSKWDRASFERAWWDHWALLAAPRDSR
jgi:predicted double-glycine peptidase